ncbi:tetratricopeptide repeat protein [Thalassobaculum sp.]|uniref:tetratricopeptide repeat protein n=1 Tax=Thalassobaculum sp. TaxID=2022740 RepID=UPI0032EAE1FE
MAEIFREIDEELQQERAAKLWQRYGGWLIAAAVGVVLAVSGNVFWTRYSAQLKAEMGDRYEAASELVVSGNPKDGAQAFAALADDAGAGYATLARLREAAALATAGDTEAAIIVFRKVAADAKPPYADLARLRAVRLGIDTGDTAGLLRELAPVLASGNPWRPLAMETEAAIHLQAGDTSKALAIYKSLADDASTPSQLRARATEMVRALGD